MESSPISTATGRLGQTMHEGGSPAVNFLYVDFSLRLLLFQSSLAALLVLATTHFQHWAALAYLLAALTVICLYSALTLLTSAFAVTSPSPSSEMLLNLVLLDALMAGVLASATGAGGAVAFLGQKGNSHVRWNKICNVHDKFCRHIASAFGVSLVASIVLVALVILSAYSLYLRAQPLTPARSPAPQPSLATRQATTVSAPTPFRGRPPADNFAMSTVLPAAVL